MKRAISKLILPDVNVLLAVAWPNHQCHAAAIRALAAPGVRWATCAVTELGFIRLSSNPAVVSVSKRPAEAVAMLSALVADFAHVYLEPMPSPAAPDASSVFERLLGHQQVTDSFLLYLARQAGAVFVTFDQRMASLGGSDDKIEILS